jgi:hypothetical protein
MDGRGLTLDISVWAKKCRSSRGLMVASMREERRVRDDYWLADSFDSLRGEFFSNTATRWRPEGGT